MSSSRSKLKITFNSPVVLAFAFVCAVALGVNFLTGGVSNQLLFMTYKSSLKDPLTYVRLFTHAIGHGGWDHLVGNMSYILLLGPMLEEKYGSKKLLAVMRITAFVTGVFNSVMFPHSRLLGASGVVFAFIILSSITRIRNREIPLTFILVTLIYIGAEVYNGIFVADNVAQFAHIIGGLVGGIAGFVMMRDRA